MAALLRQGATRIGGSVLQRTQPAVTSPAVAEERRRLVQRHMYSTKQGAAGKQAGEKSMLEKWHEGRLAFQRFDEEFTKVLHGSVGLFAVYAILSWKDPLAEKRGARPIISERQDRVRFDGKPILTALNLLSSTMLLLLIWECL